MGKSLTRQGFFEKALQQYQHVLAIPDLSRYPRREAVTLSNMAYTYWHWGRYETAMLYAQKALPVFEKYSDRVGQAQSLTTLGLICFQTHQFTRAIRYYEEALPLYVSIGDRHGEASVYANLGNVYFDFGDYEWAEAYYNRAITIDRETGNRPGEAITLTTMSLLYNQMGEYEPAQNYCEQALPIFQTIRDRPNEVNTLSILSNILNNQGFYDQAHMRIQVAWERSLKLDTREYDVPILINWGNALIGLENYQEATRIYRQALVACEQLEMRPYRIYPLAGLAVIAYQAGKLTEAAQLAQQAFDHIEEHYPDAISDLFQVYLTCYQILTNVAKAHDDEEMNTLAQTVLSQAYQALTERISNIGDEDLRQDILDTVAPYHQIVTLHQQQS